MAEPTSGAETVGEPLRREPACPGPAGGSRLSVKMDGRRPSQAGVWTDRSAALCIHWLAGRPAPPRTRLGPPRPADPSLVPSEASR